MLRGPIPSVEVMAPMLGKAWRYGMTAGLAAIVDVVGFALLVSYLVPGFVAALLSYLCAVGVNYTCTARLVYNAPLSWAGLRKFFYFASLGFAINITVTMAVLYAFDPTVAALAKITGVGVAFVANFLMVHLIVFKTD